MYLKRHQVQKCSRYDCECKTATIPQSGTIERELVYDIYNKPYATLTLKYADFNNAINIQKALNNHFQANPTLAKDLRTISPYGNGGISKHSEGYRNNDKIIIDKQNGTIITSEIGIMPITISCGATKIVDSTDTTQANLIVANKPHISSLVWALQRIGSSNINPY